MVDAIAINKITSEFWDTLAEITKDSVEPDIAKWDELTENQKGVYRSVVQNLLYRDVIRAGSGITEYVEGVGGEKVND